MNFNLPEITNFDETIGMFKYFLIATGLCFLPFFGLTQYKIKEIGQEYLTIQIDTLQGLVERVGCEGGEIHSICDTSDESDLYFGFGALSISHIMC
jgi:hypothetical protein